MKKPTLYFLFFLTTILSYAQSSALTKQESIDLIKDYYETFKTGFYEYAVKDGYPKKGEIKKYRQYTGNYNVKMDGCHFEISFDEISWPNDCTTPIDYDIYNWSNPKKKDRKTIEFNGNEIDSLSSGNRELGESEVINCNMGFYSSKSIKITTVPLIRDRFSGNGKHLFELKINAESQENTNFSNIEIVKAFRRLIALCKT